MTYIFDWLFFTQCHLFFFYPSSSLSLWTVFDSLSSNIDEVLSINPSTNVFVFGDFNANHKDWLAYSGGSDRPGEVCYNFSISHDLTQTVSFDKRIPDCVSESPTFLDSFLSSGASICSTMASSQLENSDYVVVTVSTDFSSNSNLLKSRFRLELMYISLIESIRSSLTDLHVFQLLALLQ